MHTGNMDQKHKPKYFLIMCCSDQLQYNCTEKIEMPVANTAGKKITCKGGISTLNYSLAIQLAFTRKSCALPRYTFTAVELRPS